jgi:hypothetical protein
LSQKGASTRLQLLTAEPVSKLVERAAAPRLFSRSASERSIDRVRGWYRCILGSGKPSLLPMSESRKRKSYVALPLEINVMTYYAEL